MQQSVLASVDPASGVNSVEYLGGCDFTSRKKNFLVNEAASRAGRGAQIAQKHLRLG